MTIVKGHGMIEEQEFLLQRRKHGDGGKPRTSVAASIANLSTTIVGAGIMSLPATIKILGVPLGLVLLVVVGIFTYFSLEFMIRFSSEACVTSYGALMADAFGAPGRICLQIFVVVKTLGILIIYLIIIADVISGTTSDGIHRSGILEEWFGLSWWTSRIGVLFLTTVIVLLPLVSFRYVDSLKVSSAISVALAFLFLLVTVAITTVKLINADIYMPRLLPDVTNQASFMKLFQVVPVIATAYLCHFNVHPIQNELAVPSAMYRVAKVSIALCSTIYVLTALFGYLLFGEETMADVLANFNTDLGIPYSSFFNVVTRASYAIHLMLVFPVINFALRLNVDEFMFPTAPPLVSDSKRFFLITSGLMIMVFIGAAFIPTIWYVFQFLGATADVSLAFIFPAIIVLRDAHGISKRTDRCLACFMVVLAVISSIIALSSDISDIIG